MRTLPIVLFALALPTPAQDIAAVKTVPRVATLDDVGVFFLHEDNLWTCDGNGAQLRRWSPEGFDLPAPIALSPDGRRLAHARFRVELIDEGGTVTDLGNYAGHALDTVWSPDGRSIAFGTTSRTVGEGGIWIVGDVTAGDAPARFTAEGTYEDNPTWSPDGRWLALAAMRSQTIERHADTIWVERESQLELVERATGKRTVACERLGEIDDIAWSPDGRWLAFEVDGELLAVPMAGGVPGPHRVLPARPRRGGTLRWHPDSSLLLADRNVVARKVGHDARRAEDALLLVPLTGDPREILLRDGAYGAAFSPDGAWILVACGDRTLRRVEVATGAQTTLFAGVDHWSPVFCRGR